VLFNLLDNAIKYTTEGTVTLTVDTVDPEPATGTGLRVRCRVDDTGAGIPGDRIQQALRPFEQIHDDPLPRNGVGLGLALCLRLVDLMGGELQLQSRVSGGAWASVPAGLPPPDDRHQGTRVSLLLDLARVEASTAADHPALRRPAPEDTPDTGEAPGDPATPPQEVLHELRDLLETGDVAALTALAERELTDYPVFLGQLLELARSFRLNELEQWLASLESPDASS
jgi:signal transduction histidine kinase